jgi:hypothetical protein
VKAMFADADIGGARVCREFTYRRETFKPSRRLSPDEVLAISARNRQALVDGGFLEIIPMEPMRSMKAMVADRKPPPWNGKAATERQNAEMRAWIEKTLAALIDHDAEVEYQGFLRAIGQLGRLPPQAMRDLCMKWMKDFGLREARYGDLKPLRKAVRKRLPGVEEWIREPPGRQGQPRPQRERDERNARLLLALKYVNRIRNHFPAGRWPRALVVEVAAAHYKFSVGEVERALHQGAKELRKRPGI